MQVQKIQNNNTSFNAKLSINNKSGYVIDESVLEGMAKYAKKIGSEADTITVEIGKLKVFPKSCSEMEHEHDINTLSQDIIVNSEIKGLTESKNIGYTTNLDVYPGDMAVTNIWNYLDRLVKKLKPHILKENIYAMDKVNIDLYSSKSSVTDNIRDLLDKFMKK